MAEAHRRFKRWGWLLLVPVILLAVVVGLMSSSDDGSAQTDTAPTILPVQAVTLQAASGYTVERVYTGLVQAGRSSQLSFERSGRVIALPVDEGEQVQAGDLLAEIDTRRIEAERQGVLAQRSAEQARLKEMVAGPRQQVIDEARATVAERRATLSEAQLRERRLSSMLERQAATQDEADASRFTREATEARVRAAENRLSELEAGTRPEQIEAQRALVDSLDAQLASLQVDLEDSRIVAPFDGSIDRRWIDEGTVVSAGMPVLDLIEDGPRELHVGVPAEAAGKLTLGEQRSIKIDGVTHRGVLDRILPTLDDATRTRRLVFLLDASYEPLPGQVGRVALSRRVETEGYWLPESALIRGERGLWAAFLIQQAGDTSGEVVRRAELEVLYTGDGRAFVRGALEPGDRVVATGVQRLVAGQSVDLSQAKQASAIANESGS
ncbi:efflux RND transporter periplasmic adaptor subunit [Mucisphaera sp.]|uniref:efflux RND transporter periplasmic adaptor subunit n=1 Tax=Mucisphaera sp. TaxID=2913024 RepID=UPI003D0DA4ED